MECNDYNVLYNAVYENDIKSLERELVGVSPDLQDEQRGHTLLQAACEEDSIDAIRFLLELGADPNYRFTMVSRVSGQIICRDSVALMHAQSVDAAKLLIRFGADVSVTDGDGLSAIDWANRDSNKGLVEYLSEK